MCLLTNCLRQSSSTTSSSSRRTYTSTSSKHPLPARPDWAVGLKAQPTLSHHRGHDQPRSPPHIGMQSQSNIQLSAAPFQSADFPPLSNMASPPEKRSPAVAGVWNNVSSTKSIMAPNGGSQINALVHYSNGQDGYERPPPKSNNELFNPKGSKRQYPQDRPKVDHGIEAALLEKMENLGMTSSTQDNRGENMSLRENVER